MDPRPTANVDAAPVRPAVGGDTTPLKRAFRRVLRQPAFLTAVVVLLAAALGLNASVRFMKLHFKKERVELARPLGAIADRFGSWVQVSQDTALNHEMQDVLGTE